MLEAQIAFMYVGMVCMFMFTCSTSYAFYRVAMIDAMSY